jgi:hypothetical protein
MSVSLSMYVICLGMTAVKKKPPLYLVDVRVDVVAR